MPKLSRRGNTAYASPIRKLEDAAQAATERGTRIYHLNIGQPDIPTPPVALDALRRTDLKVLEYGPARGLLSYRKKLVEYYRRHRLELAYQHIIVTTGASEAIYLTLLSCCDPGDEIIIPEPFYAIYNGFAQSTGIKIVPIATQFETGFALPDAETFAEKITDRTRAILICNPNNPTGCLYTETQIRQLAEVVRRHDLFLLCDEVYREFNYGDSDFFSVLEVPELERHAVVMDSISKRYSSCGARVGAVVSRNVDLLDNLTKFARFRLCPPGLGQILAEATLDEASAYLENAVAEYRRRRDLLVRRLRVMPGVDCYEPGGAFYCFVRLPVDDTEDFCRWLLESFSHQSETIMLAPGAGFYATPNRGKNEVRIAYVLNERDLNRAMDLLERALAVYPPVASSLSDKVRKSPDFQTRVG